MKNFLNEEELAGDQQYAKELLTVQAWYNQEMKKLNDMLAKKKNDVLINYQKRALTTKKVGTTPAPSQTTKQQTGTVNTAGTPVTAKGAPAVESYEPNILNMKEINEEDEIRYSPGMGSSTITGRGNWYERPVTGGHQEKIRTPRRKVMDFKRKRKIQEMQNQIEDLKSDIESLISQYKSPSYEGIEGEIEEFFAEIGPEASDILNSGSSAEEKYYALTELGVKNPKDLIDNYYYYYPEFDSSKEKDKKQAEKEVTKLQSKIDKLQATIDKWESVYEGLNETKFDTKDTGSQEYNDLKDYMDAENISYAEDEDGTSINFNEEELDAEWQDQLSDMGLEKAETEDILTIEDDDEETVSDDKDITDVDQKIDEDKVFYVKIEDEGEAFVGKIYKLFDEGDWRAKVVDGQSKTFDQLNYDPSWDEFDIIAFLRENYADAELMSEEEFNGHAEEPEVEPEEVEEALRGNGNIMTNKNKIRESTKLEPNLDGKIDMKTHKLLRKDQNKNDKELDNIEKELTEHQIPTLDQFLNEIKFSDGMEFDISGELHTEERSDGWYVVGENMLIPVNSEEEGEEYILKLGRKKEYEKNFGSKRSQIGGLKHPGWGRKMK